MATLRELRQIAKNEYKRGTGNKALKGYSKMSKPQLLTALNRKDEAKQATKESRAIASTKTADIVARKAVAGMEGRDKEVARAQAKGRLLRAVKREIDSARKANPDITQDELRSIAGKAFVREAQAIKQGKSENKPKRGGNVAQKADEVRKSQETTKRIRNAKDGTFQPKKGESVLIGGGYSSDSVHVVVGVSKDGKTYTVEPKELSDEQKQVKARKPDAYRRKVPADVVIPPDTIRLSDPSKNPKYQQDLDMFATHYEASGMSKADARRKAEATMRNNAASYREVSPDTLPPSPTLQHSQAPTTGLRQNQRKNATINAARQQTAKRLEAGISEGLERLKRGVDGEGNPIDRETHEQTAKLLTQANQKLMDLGVKTTPLVIPQHKSFTRSLDAVSDKQRDYGEKVKRERMNEAQKRIETDYEDEFEGGLTKDDKRGARYHLERITDDLRHAKDWLDAPMSQPRELAKEAMMRHYEDLAEAGDPRITPDDRKMLLNRKKKREGSKQQAALRTKGYEALSKELPALKGVSDRQTSYGEDKRQAALEALEKAKYHPADIRYAMRKIPEMKSAKYWIETSVRDISLQIKAVRPKHEIKPATGLSGAKSRQTPGNPRNLPIVPRQRPQTFRGKSIE